MVDKRAFSTWLPSGLPISRGGGYSSSEAWVGHHGWYVKHCFSPTFGQASRHQRSTGLASLGQGRAGDHSDGDHLAGARLTWAGETVMPQSTLAHDDPKNF